MAHGGARKGSGRKSVHSELEVRNLAIAAIIKVYGSEAKGFEALLLSGEATLQKFVWEHAYGKPKEKVEHSTDPEKPVLFKLDDRFSNS
jgi:hypothetical protein